MADYHLEESYSGLVAGVDEVGRGPLAGPVVACSFTFTKYPEKELFLMVDDSKKLTSKKREKLYHFLNNIDYAYYGLGAASVKEIDRYNISEACFLAMQRSMKKLEHRLHRSPDIALVDGNRSPLFSCQVQTVIKGDAISLSIAAASVIAKVVRDRLMKKLGEKYPLYKWYKNAGYGTLEHRNIIKDYGINRHHRLSFAPMRSMMKKNFI